MILRHDVDKAKGNYGKVIEIFEERVERVQEDDENFMGNITLIQEHDLGFGKERLRSKNHYKR